jgi:hypothetical protein
MSTLFTAEDSYENWNEFRNFYTKSLNNVFISNLSFYKPQSYLNVFNAFRADFEDFNFFTSNSQEDASNSYNPLNIIDLSFVNSNLTTDDSLESTRISNPLTLRATTRNSIVNYNALQKVFRSRFEDGRANANLNQFSELSSIQPFLNTERVPYEKLLGKTKTNFFNVNFFNNTTLNLFNNFSASSL